jgi:phosphoribosylanthranilate isomerase
MKAVAMDSDHALSAATAEFPDAAALLLDSHNAGGLGGTGRSFDWSLATAVPVPLVLAGGLTPENVGRAIAQVRPWGVDVSSGVEDEPGIKNPDRMRQFIKEAKREY